MRQYVKPSIKKSVLLSEKRVANTCWGYHNGGSPTWWYDKNGTAAGFVSYYIHEGSKCGRLDSMLTVTWYQNRAALTAGEGRNVNKNESVTTDGGQTVQPFNDTLNYLISLGGNQGQNFSGENDLIQDDEGMS